MEVPAILAVPLPLSVKVIPDGSAPVADSAGTDTVTFAGTAAQRVSVNVAPVCCSAKVSILRPDGTTLVAPTSIGTSGGLIEPATLPVSGDYTIAVDPQAMALGSATLTRC